MAGGGHSRTCVASGGGGAGRGAVSWQRIAAATTAAVEQGAGGGTGCVARSSCGRRAPRGLCTKPSLPDPLLLVDCSITGGGATARCMKELKRRVRPRPAQRRDPRPWGFLTPSPSVKLRERSDHRPPTLPADAHQNNKGWGASHHRPPVRPSARPSDMQATCAAVTMRPDAITWAAPAPTPSPVLSFARLLVDEGHRPPHPPARPQPHPAAAPGGCAWKTRPSGSSGTVETTGSPPPGTGKTRHLRASHTAHSANPASSSTWCRGGWRWLRQPPPTGTARRRPRRREGGAPAPRRRQAHQRPRCRRRPRLRHHCRPRPPRTTAAAVGVTTAAAAAAVTVNGPKFP